MFQYLDKPTSVVGSKVPQVKPLKKQFKFSKDYKRFVNTLETKNEIALRKLKSIRNQTGFLNHEHQKLLKAIFEWSPNHERYPIFNKNMSVYDPRNSTYVYTIPVRKPPQTLFCHATVVPETLNTTNKTPVPKKANKINEEPSFVFMHDYQTTFKTLLQSHSRLIRKLKNQKKLLIVAKKNYVESITLCGLHKTPHAIRTKPAFAPGFVSFLPKKTGTPESKSNQTTELSTPPASPQKKKRSGKQIGTPTKKRVRSRKNSKNSRISTRKRLVRNQRKR